MQGVNTPVATVDSIDWTQRTSVSGGKKIMSANISRKLSAIILCLLVVSGTQALLGQSSCYIPWTTEAALNGYANGQVGLAVLNNQIVVTWGDSSSDQFNAAYSSDGINWSYQTLSSYPLMMGDVPYWPDSTFSGGGVSMTVSTACNPNAAYAAYVDETGQNIWAASYNGASWTLSSNPIYTIPYVADYTLPTPTFQTNPPSPGYFITAAPALFGENTTPPHGYSRASPIGYAFPSYLGYTEQLANKGSSYYTYVYGITQAQFNCNFSTNSGVPEVGYDACLFWDPNTSYCDSLYQFEEGFKTRYLSGPQSPLWTGAVGPNSQMVELRAMATGNALGNDNPPIWYAFGSPNWFSTYGDTEGCLGTNCAVAPPNGAGQYANNGIGGAINPADGSAWFVYTCRYFNSDTCPGPGSQYIRLYHMTSEGRPGNGQLCNMTGEAYGNSDSAYSNSAPAITFWNGHLWIAYQAGNGGNGQVTVVSINPSNIGFNGGPPGPSTA